MIKVNYSPKTNLVKGYYPDSINYTSIPEPYIEITEKQHQEGLGKIMCVLNGIYQEYVKPHDVILTELKITRIQEIKTKRDTFLSLNINVSTGEYKATQTAKSLFFNAVNGRTSTQFPMEWRLANDITWVSLSKEQAYELYDAFEAQETSGYQQESNFIRMINDAKTIEEVESIVIEFK